MVFCDEKHLEFKGGQTYLDVGCYDCYNYANAVCCTAEPPWHIVSTANIITIALAAPAFHRGRLVDMSDLP